VRRLPPLWRHQAEALCRFGVYRCQQPVRQVGSPRRRRRARPCSTEVLCALCGWAGVRRSSSPLKHRRAAYAQTAAAAHQRAVAGLAPLQAAPAPPRDPTPARACVVALLPLPPGVLGRAAAAQRPSRRVPRAARRGPSPPAQAVGGGLAGGGWRTGRGACAWNSCAYRSAHNAVRPSRARRGASRQPVEGFSVRASVCDGRRARFAHSLLRKHAFCRSGFAVLVPRQCDSLAGLCGVIDGQ
jgi:hypothetical protein